MAAFIGEQNLIFRRFHKRECEDHFPYFNFTLRRFDALNAVCHMASKGTSLQLFI